MAGICHTHGQAGEPGDRCRVCALEQDNARLRAELADVKALAYNTLPGRTLGDHADTPAGQVARLGAVAQAMGERLAAAQAQAERLAPVVAAVEALVAARQVRCVCSEFLLRVDGCHCARNKRIETARRDLLELATGWARLGWGGQGGRGRAGVSVADTGDAGRRAEEVRGLSAGAGSVGSQAVFGITQVRGRPPPHERVAVEALLRAHDEEVSLRYAEPPAVAGPQVWVEAAPSSGVARDPQRQAAVVRRLRRALGPWLLAEGEQGAYARQPVVAIHPRVVVNEALHEALVAWHRGQRDAAPVEDRRYYDQMIARAEAGGYDPVELARFVLCGSGGFARVDGDRYVGWEDKGDAPEAVRVTTGPGESTGSSRT